MGLLTCTRCKETKPATSEWFPLHNKKKNGLDSWCRACRSEYRKARRVPSGVVDIDKAQLARQVTECVICGDTQDQQLAIDHNHDTGEFRGILCTSCNSVLGLAGDNPEILDRASDYLRAKGSYLRKELVDNSAVRRKKK